MNLTLMLISSRRSGRGSGPGGPAGELVHLYLSRAARYAPCTLRVFPTEAAALEFAEGLKGRTRPALLLADSRGEALSSEEFAAAVGSLQDAGIQQVLVGIGPADGWSAAARGRADQMIAFGRMTLPHELAAAVAAEQIYRALTIRAGHPYHDGH